MEAGFSEALHAKIQGFALNIVVVQHGKLKDPSVIALRDEYVKRFQRYGKLRVIETTPKKNKSIWPELNTWKILLDERGSSYSSEAFAEQLQQWSMTHGTLAFAIGEAYGHDAVTREESHAQIRLSDMVLPHQLAHVLLLEQIYRAACILNNSPYHHGS